MTKPSTYLSSRFLEAVKYATEMYKDQVRKGTTIPYICRPLGVASLVLEAGGDEDQAIATLLHDVPEDCGGEPRLLEIAEIFGERIAHIVRIRPAVIPRLPVMITFLVIWKEYLIT